MVGSIVTGVTQLTRAPLRGLTALAVVAGLALTGLVAIPAAGSAPAKALVRHEVYPVPPGGVYTFHGRGNGHGHGMSQWGAYGAAKVAHLSTNQILHFYYPHTTLATRSTATTIRVLLTAAQAHGRGYVRVNPAAGLAVTLAGGKPAVLATTTVTHHAITGWRLLRNGKVVDLQRLSVGKWATRRAVGTRAAFTDTAQQVPVVEPGGTVSYHGSIVGELESGAMEAVNVVNLELYLRDVVPSEMPSTWSTAALQSQAVAARTYARHGLNNPKASWFDVDGDTRDQAYGGVGVETIRATSAIAATAGEVIVDSHDQAVLAQYASSDGGWTVSGGVAYLPAKADPYDGAIRNSEHAWTRTVSASSLESDFPQVGTLTEIEITGRDGNGVWGGRVTTLKLVGSKATVSLTGADLQSALAFGTTWFRPVPLPAAPSKLTATASGTTVTAKWQAPVSVNGAAAVTGYRFTMSPGGHAQTLGASVRTASVTKLAAGTYTVTVAAISKAGMGRPATTTVKVVAG
jgi:stage II sporulation protein D